MSSQASRLHVIASDDRERLRLVRRAKALSMLSIGWMTVEAGVAIAAATAGDAAQSWLCAIIAAGALVSILANAALGWWWLDPIAGLGIAGLAAREGREAWAGEVCADCEPIERRLSRTE